MRTVYIGLPYVRVSPDTSSFLAFVRAGFQKSAVCPGFWPNPQVHSNVAICKGVRTKLLKAIRSSDKYTWSQPLAQSSSSLTVPESQDEAGD